MDLIRKLLLPIVPFYYMVTWVRNKLYDFGVKKSESYDFPVIAVGNLSVGGTGKSPMVEYLIQLLQTQYRIATLSRGYKRITKGFYKVSSTNTVVEVGDEPLQFKTKFNDVIIAVDENRRNGIENLINDDEPPQVIVLDDAYQHRKVKAGFYILLTAYGDLFCDDMVLPTGNLREPKKGADRADMIVVTKCPEDLSAKEKKRIRDKISPKSHQSLFFATITYDQELRSANHKKSVSTLANDPFCLVTGIANPAPLLDYYRFLGLAFDHMEYPDHHNFSAVELSLLNSKSQIVTTEKDYMRLRTHLPAENLWYQPIKMDFLLDKKQFDQEVLRFVELFFN